MAAIIRNAMQEYNVYPSDIDGKYKLQNVRGNAHSRCSRKTCGKSWGSHLGWITIDFQQRRISKFWQQKCKSCGQTERMHFSPDELARMIEIALIRCLALIDGTYVDNRRDGEDTTIAKPHKPELCEKCKWGERRCWVSRAR
ncbi:uncharacterized protein LOC102806637 [Saccoglossus kowalevskii]|uniref:Uncharacterized protein LOC102806637 n=1 Tax=Saccoglossus kowalevskii TaxID=10224 RepID=A0ABM0MIW5_SACKO|nr:PREDICTED: uncharacterized protein LOC102806637 [Saccoglossus kowalevskii]